MSSTGNKTSSYSQRSAQLGRRTVILLSKNWREDCASLKPSKKMQAEDRSFNKNDEKDFQGPSGRLSVSYEKFQMSLQSVGY